MGDVYITGHRNPDLDSICSAYGYSVLKNMIDKDHTYHAVRCGHMSDAVKKQFALMGIEAPPYMKDVKPKVGDVMLPPIEKVDASSPIYDLVQQYNENHPSAFPVFHGEKYVGLLSVDDITSWFLKDNKEKLPVYDFTAENIAKVIPGFFIRRGKEEFQASILAGAAAYEDFCRFVCENCNSVVALGYRKRYIEHAMEMNVPAIIITTRNKVDEIDFSSYKGTVYVTELGTAEVERRLRMSPPISTIMGKMGRKLQVTDLFDDAKEELSSSKLRGLSVFDGDKFVGYVTRRCFLHKPSYSVILVDHNEVGQSIKGIEEAQVVEIIDHHRLDALKTSLPIFIDAEPLGSTCTIVYQQFLRHNIVPDELTAKILLTGVISDTLILRSPTTTAIDKATAGALAAISGEFDIQAFGEKLFSVTDSMANRDPEKAIRSDFKVYSEQNIKIGIGQCEATTLKDFPSYGERYLSMLDEIREKEGLDWAMLMVTDVLREHSLLLTTEYRLYKKLPWNEIKSKVLDMPGVLSRKKQLLPEVIHTLD